MSFAYFSREFFRGILRSANEKLLKTFVYTRTRKALCFMNFLKDHVWASRFMIDANKQNWRFIAFFAIFFNFVGSTYNLSHFVRSKNLTPAKKFFYLNILVGQFTILIASLIPLAIYHRYFHKAKKFLFPVQLNFNEVKFILIKLKIMNVYERLTYGPKYGMKIGPTSIITPKFLFKLMLGYFAYFIACMQFLRNGKISL